MVYYVSMEEPSYIGGVGVGCSPSRMRVPERINKLCHNVLSMLMSSKEANRKWAQWDKRRALVKWGS